MRHTIDLAADPAGDQSVPTHVQRIMEVARHASSRVVGGELSYGTLGRATGADPGVASEASVIGTDRRRFSAIPWSRCVSPFVQSPPPPLANSEGQELGWTQVSDGQWR